MKIPTAFGDAAPHATVGEVDRMNKIERRVSTLNKWINERDGLVEERERLIATVKGRVKTDAAAE